MARRTEVQVVFGEDMDPASLTDDAFDVLDGSGPLPGTRNYDQASRQWTWTPTDPLPTGASLRAVVSSSVRSSSGHRPAGQFTIPFAVIDGALAPAEVLATDNPMLPVQAAIGARRVLATQGQFVFERTTGSFSELQVLPSTARALVADAIGGAAVLCTADGRDLQIVRHDGGAGSEWTNVAYHSIAGSRALTLRNNARGDLLVRWIGSGTGPSGPGEGFAALPAGSSTAAQLYSEPTGGSPAALVAIDGGGRVVALGLQAAGGRRLDPVWLRLPGPTEASESLRLPAGAELMAFDCDADGVAYAVYQLTVNGVTALRCARARPGTYLGDDLIHTGDPVNWLQFAVGRRGDAMCVFRASSTPRTLLARACVGCTGTWTPAETLADGVWQFLDGGDAVLAVTARGTAFVAYQRQASASTSELVLRRAFAGAQFSAPMVIETTAPNEFLPRPALAADDSGRAVIVFTSRTSPPLVPRPVRAVVFE